MNFLLKLSRSIDAMNLRIGVCVKWLVLVMAALSAGNALLRKLLDIGSNALLEAQWYMFAAVFLLYAGLTLCEQGHVRVDLFYRKYSEKQKCVLDILGALLCILPLSGLVIYLGFDVFWTAFADGEMSSNAGGLLIWPARLLVPLGFILLSLQAASEIIKNVAKLKTLLSAEPRAKA